MKHQIIGSLCGQKLNKRNRVYCLMLLLTVPLKYRNKYKVTNLNIRFVSTERKNT